ncbi:MAG TPA: ribose-phosphate pyrophosphokinase [Chthonomonas sp.]|jgi:ribose-phosphate pyrophosphokinase|uniref:ribose-phosphate diphosphokinase n=1 Tax=Chthonomonas sp. TaxID=2282153 RepID=UPI002B4B6ED9|nr:ribose-phosphate pyrophosphokinase [Chthonomonas sp.]HLH81178.1 ribose-phosphate pyrophosphokinase [Chthonomonas sp.]
MQTNTLRVFTGNANPELAAKIARELGIELGAIQVSKFSDGEIGVKIEESARGQDIFIIQPTCAPVNDNLMELLIMIDAFRRASARRITVALPYYGYARQDKKVRPREPVTARLVANLITTAGASRVLCVDLHAGQIQGFFDLPVDHLYAGPIIAEYLRSEGLYNGNTVVVSPDVGGVARARALAEHLNTPIAIIAKRRPAPNKVEIMEIIGDVAGKTCVMIDDMIDTAGTIVQGAEALMERGAAAVHACCTHAVLSGKAVERIQCSPLETLVVTDTVPLPEHKRIPKIKVLSVAPLIADAIRRIHEDSSVSELFINYGHH